MRLRSVVDDRPKVLAPIAGRPFLSHLLGHLHSAGFDRVVLSTGYLAEMVEAFAGDGSAWGMNVIHVREHRALGTGGALRFAIKEADITQPFLALNGDTFFTGDLSRLLVAQHQHPEFLAVLALVPAVDSSRFGIVEITESGVITAFREKSDSARGTGWINAGAYLLTPEVFEDVPDEERVSLERDIFPRLVPGGLFGVRYPEASFVDIGTPEDYRRSEKLITRWLENE